MYSASRYGVNIRWILEGTLRSFISCLKRRLDGHRGWKSWWEMQRENQSFPFIKSIKDKGGEDCMCIKMGQQLSPSSVYRTLQEETTIISCERAHASATNRQTDKVPVLHAHMVCFLNAEKKGDTPPKNKGEKKSGRLDGLSWWATQIKPQKQPTHCTNAPVRGYDS